MVGGIKSAAFNGTRPFFFVLVFSLPLVRFPFSFASFPSTSVASRYVAEKFVAHTRLRVYTRTEK